MSRLLHASATDTLAPIVATLDRVRAQRGDAPVHGVARGLLAPTGTPGWLPATELVTGDGLDALLDSAQRRWRAAPHVAGALAVKSYAYWLTLPTVVGYASARRVPLVSPENVRVRLHGSPPFLELGLVRPTVAALASDPVAALAAANVRAVPDEAALLAYLRTNLLDRHLAPLIARVHERVRVGERTLLGSVASAVAYALVRSADALPGGVAATTREILVALNLDELVDIAPDLSVQRRTCCLAFALPEPKYCSGCCVPH